MAFCPKCGAKLDDSAKFCNICGAEQEVTENVSVKDNANGTDKVNPLTKIFGEMDKNKKVGLIAVGVMSVLALVIVIAIISAIGGGGYKKPLKTLKKAINKQSTDINDYVDVLPAFAGTAYEDAMSLIKNIDKDYVETIDDSIETGIESIYDSLESSFGKNVKLTYKITGKEKLDKDECKEIADAYGSVIEMIDDTVGYDLADEGDLEDIIDLLDAFGILDAVSEKQKEKAVKLVLELAKTLEKTKVSKGYILTVDATFEGKKGDGTEEMELYVVKMNGDWCIDVLSTYAAMSNQEPDEVLEDIISKLGSFGSVDSWG